MGEDGKVSLFTKTVNAVKLAFATKKAVMALYAAFFGVTAATSHYMADGVTDGHVAEQQALEQTVETLRGEVIDLQIIVTDLNNRTNEPVIQHDHEHALIEHEHDHPPVVFQDHEHDHDHEQSEVIVPAPFMIEHTHDHDHGEHTHPFVEHTHPQQVIKVAPHQHKYEDVLH